jgi:glycosyltransferase involved in cell wall biosynthesis
LISRARGKYLTFCDADDRLLPGFLKTFSRALKENPSVGVVYGDRILLKADGKPHLKKDKRPSGKWDLIEGMLSNTGTMICRSLIKKAGKYRTDLAYLEDCELFSRLAEVTPFLRLKRKPLYAYRKRRRGSLSRKFEKVRSHYYLTIVRKMILRRYGVRVSW